MREKLLRLMKSEGLTSSRLAEILGTGASNISHIISGRSKPGYDLLRKILLCFPRINPDWLLLDAEQMYRTEDSINPGTQEETHQLSDHDANPSTDTNNLQSSTNDQMLPFANATSEQTVLTSSQSSASSKSSPEIRRVIVIYEDKTFESFTPKQ